MEEALTALLLSASGLTALVGQRIYWADRPQASALPSIVLRKVDSVPEYSGEGEAGLFSSRIQVNCWATNIWGAKLVSREVLAVFSGTHPTMGLIEFDGIYAEAEEDLSKETVAGGTEVNGVRMDFLVWHS